MRAELKHEGRRCKRIRCSGKLRWVTWVPDATDRTLYGISERSAAGLSWSCAYQLRRQRGQQHGIGLWYHVMHVHQIMVRRNVRVGVMNHSFGDIGNCPTAVKLTGGSIGDVWCRYA